jgi:hypothetical protein
MGKRRLTPHFAGTSRRQPPEAERVILDALVAAFWVGVVAYIGSDIG